MKSIPWRIGLPARWRLAIAGIAALAPALQSHADLRDDIERLIRISGLNSAKIAVSVRDTRTGKAEVETRENGYFVRASFPVVISQHSIKKPRHLGVGVKNTVEVRVELEIVKREIVKRESETDER